MAKRLARKLKAGGASDADTLLGKKKKKKKVGSTVLCELWDVTKDACWCAIGLRMFRVACTCCPCVSVVHSSSSTVKLRCTIRPTQLYYRKSSSIKRARTVLLQGKGRKVKRVIDREAARREAEMRNKFKLLLAGRAERTVRGDYELLAKRTAAKVRTGHVAPSGKIRPVLVSTSEESSSPVDDFCSLYERSMRCRSPSSSKSLKHHHPTPTAGRVPQRRRRGRQEGQDSRKGTAGA